MYIKNLEQLTSSKRTMLAEATLRMLGRKLFAKRVVLSASLFLFTTCALYILAMSTFETDNTHRTRTRRGLTPEEQTRLEKLKAYQKLVFENNVRPPDASYNINISKAERMPLVRKDIPDTRPSECSQVKYNVDQLPTISVIIPFYNEGLVMILRTVHSVLERTPEELLVDVILVNDHSTNQDLMERLEEYVKLLPDKVKLLKTTKREGLIRARMLGTHEAKGDVVMFLDAHTETNHYWAEAILQTIRNNPRAIVQPEVDQIEADTLKYVGASYDSVPRGGFSWDLRYVWMQMPPKEHLRLKTEASIKGVSQYVLPFRSAALVGCALAVRRDYFLAVGGFDEAMEVWGGENIELAMRNWLCGGEVLTHPCARVAHTFKPFAYSFDGDREKIVQKNLMRIAEVWMDDWKKFFYAATYSWPSKHTSLTRQELESLNERKKLKQRMNCKPFEWYMENIYADVPTPPADASWYGEITNIGTDACPYILSDGYVGISYFCYFHRVVPEQLFVIDNQKRFLYHHSNGTTSCIRIEYRTWLLKLGPCAGAEHEVWEQKFNVNYHPLLGQLQVRFSRDGVNTEVKCLTQVTNITPVHPREQMPQLMECTDNKYQQWRWQYHFDFNYRF